MLDLQTHHYIWSFSLGISMKWEGFIRWSNFFLTSTILTEQKNDTIKTPEPERCHVSQNLMTAVILVCLFFSVVIAFILLFPRVKWIFFIFFIDIVCFCQKPQKTLQWKSVDVICRMFGSQAPLQSHSSWNRQFNRSAVKLMLSNSTICLLITWNCNVAVTLLNQVLSLFPTVESHYLVIAYVVAVKLKGVSANVIVPLQWQ